jgi:tRNA (cmo5U34)-methyltransferase
MNVGDNIIIPGNKFSFAIAAKSFNKHVENSIPFYNEGHNLILNYIEYFVNNKSIVYDIGCSTGTLLARIKEKYSFVNAIGIDRESEMISEAKKYYDLAFIAADALDINYNNASVVTMYYTLQFLNRSSKEKLIKKLYDSMLENSALLIFEKILSKDKFIQDLNEQLYYEFKKQTYTIEEIENKTKSLIGVLHSVTSEENLELLSNCGFNTNIIFKYLNFEGYLAVK